MASGKGFNPKVFDKGGVPKRDWNPHQDCSEDGVFHPFDLPFYKFSLENWEEDKKEILDALPKEKLVETEHENIHTDFFDYATKDILPPYADLLMDILSPCMSKVMHREWIGLCAMWYQTEHKYQSHMLHNHGTVGWSSVLYVDYDPKVHTATRFLSPVGVVVGKGGMLDWFQPKVKEGDYIIFPSNIAHEALPNMSDVPRTIISCNFQTTPMFPLKQYSTK